MSYTTEQRKRAERFRKEYFAKPEDGKFGRDTHPFVLSIPQLNLWAGIREDALDYFERNQIAWWGKTDEPTGHMLSSQIACLNHLYPIRQREDLATAILRGIQPKIEKAVVLDDGYVEFEVIGRERLGLEKLHTRGANCTSIDAMMVGENEDGKRTLFLIEWKYTESYTSEAKWEGDSGQTRLDAYDSLLNEADCPIKVDDKRALFYEPFYQLMRQTLLGWQMVKRTEYGATDYVHLHVIPEKNSKLKEKVTSPGLKGETMGQAWGMVLNDPSKYVSIDPERLMKPIVKAVDAQSICSYLSARYW